jgi:hypothetical protein
VWCGSFLVTIAVYVRSVLSALYVPFCPTVGFERRGEGGRVGVSEKGIGVGKEGRNGGRDTCRHTTTIDFDNIAHLDIR